MELSGPKGIDDALSAGAKITTTKFEAERPRPLPLVREIPDPNPYPLDALGPLLKPAAEKFIEAIQAPPALCGQAVLAAANLAVQGHGDITIDGRVHPTSLFLVGVGDSGERKTGVDRIALRAHRVHEQRIAQQHEHAFETYKNLKEVYDKRRDDVLKKKAKLHQLNETMDALDSLGAAPKPPLHPIFIVEEPSYEGLIKLMAAGQPSMGLFTAEGGRLIGGYSMSEDHQLKTAAGLSELWDGNPITRIRSGDGASSIRGRRLALSIMAQPGVALALVNNPVLVDQGLNSRLLPTWPTSTAGTRTYRSIDLTTDPAVLAFHSYMKEILEAPLPLVEKSQNELAPRALPLKADAKRAWIAIHDDVERELRQDGAYASIRGLANKAPEHVLRIAGTLTLTKTLESGAIAVDEIDAGRDLMEHYLAEALRIREAAAVDPQLQTAAKVMAWARRSGGKFHFQQLYQFGPPAVRDAKSARAIIDVLLNHLQLLPLAGGMTCNGRKYAEAWLVNEEPD